MNDPVPAPPVTAAAGGCPVDHRALSGLTAPDGCPVSARAAAFDPFEPAYMQDPPDYVRWARAQEPVFWSPVLNYWVVTRYDEIKAIFRDHGRFSPANALERITPPSDEALKVLETYGYAMNRTMVNEDEPAHMARRRLLLEPFTPEAVRHHEPMVRRLAREYVDRFIDEGRADLVDRMLWEVPLTIALHFLGVGEEDMPLLRKYSVAHTVNTWGRPSPEQQMKVAHAVGNFWQLSGRILDKMRADPDQPGWMQFGIRMQKDHPEVVTDSYLHSMMMAGIVAAHETTANASANAIRLLLQHPTAWRELCEDPTLIPNAVEECLRFSGSIIAWRRVALTDVEVGGRTLPAGSKFLMIMTSGNHDDARFPDADLLDIRRDNAGEHLSFGYGAHQCMGKNLARMEMQVFLEELTTRLPHLTLARQDFHYLANTSFRGPEHLWVEWDPAQNPERRDPSILGRAQPVRIGESTAALAGRTLKVDAVTPVAHDVVQLRLVAPDGASLPRWTPGAHIDLECGDTGLSRSYSLCGDPADTGAWTVAVLKDPDSRGGSAWLHANVKPGDRIKVKGPRNHFRFDESVQRAVFVAGGIGITPVMTMARLAKQRGIDYVFHYSGRTRGAMAFVDALAAEHGDRLVLHVKDEGGRADLAALFAQPQAGTTIWACGPERMLDALAQACAGWPEDSLRVEHFHGAQGSLDPSREHAFEVVLKDSGLVVQVPADRTVLDALRAANIDVQSDCGEGLCGSCEVRVLEGEVDHRDVVLTRAERPGKMMVCCSRAKDGRLVLEL